MFGTLGLSLLLAGVLMAIPLGSANAAQSATILGVWDCQVIRSGNQSARPLLYTFHTDGTVTYSSQTNITNLGFTSRGGGYGTYTKVGTYDYEATSVENLYRNGNAGGRFLVDNVLHLNTKTDQLCTGNLPGLPGDPCPTNSNVRATKFLFRDAGGNCVLDAPLNLADPICGEVDLLGVPPPAGNGVINVVLRCDRLNTLDVYGTSAPVFPIPDPVPAP